MGKVVVGLSMSLECTRVVPSDGVTQPRCRVLR
jgi:hypothetical protein